MKRLLALAVLGALLALPATALAQEQQFNASLSADQEVPAASVPDGYAGTGMARVTLNDDHTQLSFEVSFSDLTGPLTMAHIHYGATGEAGPPMFWLTDQGNMAGTPSPLTGTLTEADFMPVDGGPQTFDDAVAAIQAGNAYVNLHTAENAPGEIRGQLTMAGLPDTSTGDASQPAGTPVMLILAVLGLVVLLPVVRRFAARLA